MIVVPCHNESRRLQPALFRQFVAAHNNIQILFVNDGSRDNTLAILEGLAGSDPFHFQVLDLQPNRGKAEAVRQGILQAAVALYHFGNGNLRGATKLFRTGKAYMDPYPCPYRGLDREAFWKDMADCFVERPEIFANADERIRALYVWHAMEEMEHKGVAYDVLVDIAKSSYLNRVGSMLMVTALFPYHVFRIMKHMLQADGFSSWQRTKIWAKGLWWLYKPGGIFMPMLGKYFSYLKPGFHPWQEPVVPSYEPWVRLLKETGDPVEAGNRLHADMTQGMAHA